MNERRIQSPAVSRRAKSGRADPRVLLGAKVKELRALGGITQEELADRCDMFRTYLSRIEGGIANPTVTVLYQLAKGLGVGVQTLFDPVTAQPPRRVNPTKPGPARGRVSR